MKKSLIIKILMMAIAMILVLAFSSCDIGLFNDDDDYEDNKDLADINKDLEKEKPSEGLKFKKATDKETGEEYYSVTGIGDCTDTVVIIPDEYDGLPVKKIGSGAFKKTAVERVYIPETVTNIAHHAFAECEALTGIALPESLETLDSNAFDGCKSAKKLYLGKNLKKISKAAFYDCSSIEVVYLPEALEEMGTNVFQNCTMLGKVVFYCNDMTSIPDGTFYECTTLQQLDLPDSLTTIGADAFRGCESISEFDIPDTVTKVGDRAFMRCTSLSKLVIPASVEVWGNFVTYFCKNLAVMEYDGTLEQWDAIKCYPKKEANEEQRVVSPNESLSMYLHVKATEVKCADGSVDIVAIMKEHGFKDSSDLNPDAGATPDDNDAGEDEE